MRATTTTLTTSATSTSYGTAVTLTATVSTAGATGTVTFSINGQTLGTGTLSSDVATLQTTALPLGSDSITAIYGGDSGDTASTSNAVTVVVTVGTVAVGITSSKQEALFNFTSTVTLNATLSTAIQVLTQGAAGLDYQYATGGTCAAGATYTSGQSCTVDFTFAPKAPGLRLGAAQLYDNSATPVLLATDLVSGISSAPLAEFADAVSQTALESGSTLEGVAVDGADDVFYSASGGIKEIAASTGAVSTITSGDSPFGLAIDGAGNLYVAEGANTVRKIVATNGVVSSTSASMTVGSGFQAPEVSRSTV